MIERACGTAGFVPHAIANCTDFPAMLALVAAGTAIALVPQLATYHLPEGVSLHPVTPATTRDIFALTRPGGIRHPAVRVVLDQLNTASAVRCAASRSQSARVGMRPSGSPASAARISA